MKQLVIEFSDGDELMEGIVQAAKEHNIDYARFREGTGELREFDLISDDFNSIPLANNPHILAAVSGRVLKQKGSGEPKVNFHLTLFRKGAKTKPLSGELKKGIANGTVSLVLDVSDMGKIIE
ncbi:MAG: DUF296 domain-containing protein [Candidatus Diapherotrites archaeon]